VPPKLEAIDPVLVRRVASALVLAPPVLLAVWWGQPAFEAVIAAVAAIMAYEWARLCQGGRVGLAGWTLIAVALAVAAAAIWFGARAGLLALLAGVVVVHFAGHAEGVEEPRWLTLGVGAVGAPSAALIWLRADPAYGLATCLWLIATVWATDIGAYFAGRAIGGPRLAPSISPKKTWAGLVGGMVSAGLVGWAAALIVNGADVAVLVPLGAALAVVAQIGDLSQSGFKRHFGAKDTGSLIPGHGGLLDRVDGFITTAPAVALLSWLAGRSVVQWP
jgi:phosphatidate cytidylyltransferase